MAKTKRSFIQRLIGRDGNPVSEEQIDYETRIENSQGINQINHPNMQSEHVAVSNMDRPQEAGRGENEWVADQEGQLTIDVYQTDTEIVIKSTIAGVKPEDLDVQINNDMVTIKGERRHDEEVREEDYYYQECYWGAFSRSIILPVDVAANKSEATMKNGILTIKLPKSDAAQSRKIQVRGY